MVYYSMESSSGKLDDRYFIALVSEWIDDANNMQLIETLNIHKNLSVASVVWWNYLPQFSFRNHEYSYTFSAI